MAAKTGAQLVTESLAYGFDSTAYSGRMTAWLTEATRDICRKFDPPVERGTQTLTTTTGTSSLTLPTDFSRLRNLRLDLYQFDLDPVEIAEFDQLPTSTGLPRIYTVEVSTLYLWPTPDTAYTLTLRYTKIPADIANDTSVGSLGEDLDPAIIHYAVAQAYAAEDDAQMHQFHLGEYLRITNSVMSDKRLQVNDGPRQVAGTWANY